MSEEGVSYSSDALDEAVRVTGGYPYFVQELGYAIWTLAAGPEITLDDVRTAVPAYEAKLDASFFRVRLDCLGRARTQTAKERSPRKLVQPYNPNRALS